MAEDKKSAELRVRCEEEMKRKLEKIAREEERSLSGQVVYFLRKAIEDYLSGD